MFNRKKRKQEKALKAAELLIEQCTKRPPEYDVILQSIQNEVDINMEYGDDKDERSLLANIIAFYPRFGDEDDEFEYGEYLHNIVELFLDNGFDVKKYGFECLHALCWSTDDQWILPMAERLIDCGADLEGKSEEGDSILDLVYWRVSDWMDGELKNGNLFSAYYQMVDQVIDGKEYHGIRAWEACKGKRIDKVEIMESDMAPGNAAENKGHGISKGMILWCEGLPLYIRRYLTIYVDPYYSEKPFKCKDASEDYADIIGKTIGSVIFSSQDSAVMHFEGSDKALVIKSLPDPDNEERSISTDLTGIGSIDHLISGGDVYL